MRRRIHACHMRRRMRIHACHMRRRMRIHACHMRRRIHACHMRRRIHACHMKRRIHLREEFVGLFLEVRDHHALRDVLVSGFLLLTNRVHIHKVPFRSELYVYIHTTYIHIHR
jgi:hypothetical protein